MATTAPDRTGPLGDVYSAVELIDTMGDELRIVQAARVSYGRDVEWNEGSIIDDKDARLIRYLLKHGHWSPFEHCKVTLHISCPIHIARQWFTHKSWSFNEISRRYTSEDIQFYHPRCWRAQDQTNKQASCDELEYDTQTQLDLLLGKVVAVASQAYRDALQMGAVREQARMLLPQNLYTRFYATASLRSLLHFLQVRDHAGAQWEMVQYAQAVADIVQDLYPVTYDAWKELHHATT
jgi:thymidylate synthase (FAD)